MAFDPAASFAAAEVIGEAVDRCIATVYDRYLAKRELEYAVARTLAEAASAINSRLPVLDALLDLRRDAAHRVSRFAQEDLDLVAGAGAWDAEAEPLPAPVDGWASGLVGMRASAPTRLAAAPAPATTVASGAVTSRRAGGVAGLPAADGGTVTEAPPSTTRGRAAAAVGPAALATAATAPPAATKRTAAPPVSASSSSPPPRPSEPAGPASPAGAGAGRKGGVDSAAAAAAKSMKGKQIVLDDRGLAIPVVPPAAHRMPPATLPVSVLVEGAPSSLGASVVAAVKSGGVQVVAAASGTPAGAKRMGGGNKGSPSPSPSAPPPSPPKPAPRAKAAASPVKPGSVDVSTLPKGERDRYYRPQPGVQPPLTDSLAASGALSAGVSITVGKKTVTGAPAAAGGAAGAGSAGPGVSKEAFKATLAANAAAAATVSKARVAAAKAAAAASASAAPAAAHVAPPARPPHQPQPQPRPAAAAAAAASSATGPVAGLAGSGGAVGASAHAAAAAASLGIPTPPSFRFVPPAARQGSAPTPAGESGDGSLAHPVGPSPTAPPPLASILDAIPDLVPSLYTPSSSAALRAAARSSLAGDTGASPKPGSGIDFTARMLAHRQQTASYKAALSGQYASTGLLSPVALAASITPSFSPPRAAPVKAPTTSQRPRDRAAHATPTAEWKHLPAAAVLAGAGTASADPYAHAFGSSVGGAGSGGSVLLATSTDSLMHVGSAGDAEGTGGSGAGSVYGGALPRSAATAAASGRGSASGGWGPVEHRRAGGVVVVAAVPLES